MDEVIPRDELEEEVAFSALGVVARLATEFRLPLKRLKQLGELAYYRETRRRDMKMKEIQEVMDVGFAKVGTLSRQLKDHQGRRGMGLGLKRRMLLLLWAGPLTEGHFFTAFPEVEREEVKAVLDELIEDGRVEVVQARTPTYQLADSLQRLVEDKWVARIEALNSLMTNVAQVVHARFFAEGERPAFVRTLNFRVRPEDVGRLQEVYVETVLPLVRELDGAVGEGEASVPLKLSFLFAENTDSDDVD